MVLADILKKPHPYFGAPQSAQADGKDPFIHLRKKRSYLDRFFYVRTKVNIALFLIF